MKVLGYKCVVARRRRLIYAVLLLFVCCFITYKLVLSFIHSAVTNSDNIKEAYSTKGFHITFESLVKQKRRVDSAVSLITESTKSTVDRLETTITKLKGPYSALQVSDNDNLVAEITSGILATMDKKYVDTNREPTETCSTNTIIGNSCKIGSCLQLQLPSDLRTRVQQIATPTHLQLDHHMKMLLAGMADKVPGYYDLILVSAVSSSHLEEGQAMLYNIHTYLFPHLRNFTFIYYNLGLLEEQRDFLANICRCHLIDFPYEVLPEFISFRKCYAWKPLIVKAHISRSNLIVWMDASVRFDTAFFKFTELLGRARSRGLQVFLNKQTIGHITLPRMFHFFGDEACVYVNSSVIVSGVMVFHNDLFVQRVILEPWAACAVSRQCMCPSGLDLHKIRISCHKEMGQYHYGTCHRFDQSAISIILVKLYQERLDNIVVSMKEYVDMKRGTKMTYPYENVTGVSWISNKPI